MRRPGRKLQGAARSCSWHGFLACHMPHATCARGSRMAESSWQMSTQTKAVAGPECWARRGMCSELAYTCECVGVLCVPVCMAVCAVLTLWPKRRLVNLAAAAAARQDAMQPRACWPLHTACSLPPPLHFCHTASRPSVPLSPLRAAAAATWNFAISLGF